MNIDENLLVYLYEIFSSLFSLPDKYVIQEQRSVVKGISVVKIFDIYISFIKFIVNLKNNSLPLQDDD